jgi:hypothetical protein
MKKKTGGTKSKKSTMMMLPKIPKEVKNTLSKITKPIEAIRGKFVSKTIFGEFIIAVLVLSIIALIVLIVLSSYPDGQSIILKSNFFQN